MEMEGDQKRETGEIFHASDQSVLYVVNTRARCLQECIKLAQHATAIFKHGSWMLISEYRRETAWRCEVVFVGS